MRVIKATVGCNYSRNAITHLRRGIIKMKSNNRYAGVDTFALKVIRSQVRKLIQSHPCFQGYDFEDLEQELVLDFILRWPKFDPDKGRKHTHILPVEVVPYKQE